MLYNLLIIVFCITLLLLFSIFLTSEKIIELSDYSKINKKTNENDIPKNKIDFIKKCSPCVYNSSNNCICTNDLDTIYSRGGNRN
jgi:hypothetical protein